MTSQTIYEPETKVETEYKEGKWNRKFRILEGNVIRISAEALIAMQQEKNRLTGKNESLFEANEAAKEIVNPEFI